MRVVNNIYGAAGLSNRERLTQQATVAYQGYEAAQSRLEAFVANNRLATLQREIEARQALLDTYQSARTALQTQPVNLQLNSEQQVLADYYEDLRRIERWLAAAHSLHSQVEARSTSTAFNLGNLLALVALQNRIFDSSVPVDLQVDLTTGGVDPIPVADVKAVIAVLEERRDLTWETYQTLVRKQAETEIAIQTVGSEVRVASKAAVPEKPTGARRMITMVFVAVFTISIAILAQLMHTWWKLGRLNESYDTVNETT